VTTPTHGWQMHEDILSTAFLSTGMEHEKWQISILHSVLNLEWHRCVLGLHYNIYNLLLLVVISVVYWMFGSLSFALYVVVFYF